MSTSLESFVNVLKRSGLVDEPVIARSLDTRQESGEPPTGENFAEFLVETDVITAWQAAKLLQGKHKGFFLGKYKLLRLLGKGGMSSVYLAEHVLMRRRCAIKVLPWKLVKDSSYLQRFHREAQAVAALDHPNIVRAYDIDHEKDGNLEIHFLVMEFVEGRNLFDLVQQVGPLPAITAADYIRQGALGLAHAHKAGMVHRDVKPGNFIVDQHGTVKLMDLGLARVAAEEGDPSLTIAHDERVLGTADYLAPEQAVDSHLVDTRADLYSLGCTLYFLLTGRPPFNEGTLTQRLLAHQTKEPTPVESLRPDVPASLMVILRKLMMKDREQRTQTAEDAAEEMARWLSSQNGVSTGTALPRPAAPMAVGSVGSNTETVGPFAPHASGEMTTKKLHRDDGLGDFLSSLSDVEPVSGKQTSSMIQKGARGGTREAAQKASGGMDIPKMTVPTTMPSFTTGGFSPASAKGNAGSSKSGTHGDSVKMGGKKPFPALATLVPVWERLRPYRFPLAGGGVLLLLLLAYLMLGRGTPERPQTPGGAPTPISAGGDAVTPTAPATPARPAVSGSTVTVGPTQNFGTIKEAVAYIQENAFSSSNTPVREIRLADKLTLRDTLTIDNSGLGSFPRGVKIIGSAEYPAKWQSTGSEPVLTLNAVDGMTLENVIIDCQGTKEAIQLQGFMSSMTLVRVAFENVQNVAIAGVGFSGLGDQPALIQECTFRGTSGSATAIQLRPGSGQDSRDVRIRQCRFLGPFGSCITVEGGAETLSFRQNLFHDAAAGIVFSGAGDPVRGQLIFINNTFHRCAKGIVFDSGPAATSQGFRFAQNLFVDGAGGAVVTQREQANLDQLGKGAQPSINNWTDRGPVDSANELDLFSQQGRTGVSVNFASTDPADAQFLKPVGDEFRTPAAGSGETLPFVGAVAP